jgi:hypothetical protein
LKEHVTAIICGPAGSFELQEATMLAKLKEKNPQLVNRLAQRLFFVVNKVDCIQTSTGDLPHFLSRTYLLSLPIWRLASGPMHVESSLMH